MKKDIRFDVKINLGQSCKLNRILEAEHLDSRPAFVRKCIDEYIFKSVIEPVIDAKPEPAVVGPAIQVTTPVAPPIMAPVPDLSLPWEELRLKITDMGNKDIARFALVALHRLDMELQPAIYQEKERIDYIRHTHDKYLMLLDYYKDKLTSDDVAHIDRGIHAVFPSTLSDLDQYHNTRIRPLMFMIREYMMPLRMMTGFNVELFHKTKLFYDKYIDEFDKTDNSITKYFNNRSKIYVGFKQISTEKMLELALDENKYQEYFKKLTEGIYEV